MGNGMAYLVTFPLNRMQLLAMMKVLFVAQYFLGKR